MIHIEKNPSRRQLTVFAVSWLVFFCFIAGVAWWKTGVSAKAVSLGAIGTLIPAIGLFWRGFLRIAYLAAAYATFPIGLVVSSFILVVIYYLLLTPVGLVLRLSGYDPMRRRFDCTAKTYWSPRKPEQNSDRYFQQF